LDLIPQREARSSERAFFAPVRDALASCDSASDPGETTASARDSGLAMSLRESERLRPGATDGTPGFVSIRSGFHHFPRGP